MALFSSILVLLKGAGDLGTGVAWRLHRAGFSVVITELAQPLVVRRTVAFASAVYEGHVTVEGVTAQRAESFQQARDFLGSDIIPVIVDPETHAREYFKPSILIDAVMAKRNTGTRITDAPFVLALGPGFTPSVDCHAVIETQRGHDLGRVWWNRAAEPNNGMPGEIGGKSGERILRAPCDGIMQSVKTIGETLTTGEIIAQIGDSEIRAPFAGVLRGLLRDGITVKRGMKIGDVDPRANREHCFTISDKALAIGGGALGVVYLSRKEWADAEKEFLHSIQLKADVIQNHYHLAQVYHATERMALAREQLVMALALPEKGMWRVRAAQLIRALVLVDKKTRNPDSKMQHDLCT